jgi:hypothetical protein
VSEKKFLTFEDFKSTPDLETADVFVEEWDGNVYVIEMDAARRDWLDSSMMAEASTAIATVADKQGNKMSIDNFRVKIVAASLANKETGSHLFSLEQLKNGEAVALVGSKSSKAIGTVADVVTKLNKMGEEDVKKLGEDLGRAQVGSSDSSSPENSAAPSESSIVDSQEQS